jgi:hypothetical protein
MKAYAVAIKFFALIMGATASLRADSPDLTLEGEPFIYADLKLGDSRKVVLQKLKVGGFIQIYEERDKGLVRCTIKWDGMRYELVCKLINDKLKLCLVEGQRGWQDFFYEDVVRPQWDMVRKRLIRRYGKDRKHTDFPTMDQVPLDDMGGFITDTWELNDRTLIMTIQLFTVKDCCTEQMLQYSCSTLLIQPK